MFCVHPTPTHLLPTVPLAWALRAAGHEPIYVVRPNLLPTALSAGLQVIAAGTAFDEAAFLQARLPAGTPAALAWGEPDRTFWSAVALTQVQRAREVAEDYLAAARLIQPDVVVSDPMELAGRLVAAQLGVPLVRHRFGLDPLTGEFESVASRKLATMCRQLAVPETGAAASLILDPCPPCLQQPGARAGIAYRYVPYNGAGTTPDWLRRPGERPRICITMGTLSKHYGVAALLDVVVRVAAAQPDVEVVVAAPGLSAELVEHRQVRVVTGTPLHQFLTSCELIVHHGGAGSTLTSARAGVPQVILPQQGDQHYNAARVAAVGAGVAVSGADQLDPSMLSEALAQARRPACRAAAAELAADSGRLPAPAAMVSVLEDLVAGGGPDC